VDALWRSVAVCGGGYMWRSVLGSFLGSFLGSLLGSFLGASGPPTRPT
jgi:hypothetical protein